MTSDTSNPTSKCLCGCDQPTSRNYRPGHDASHVSNLARAIAEGTIDKRLALKALPTDALRAKLARAIDGKRREFPPLWLEEVKEGEE